MLQSEIDNNFIIALFTAVLAIVAILQFLWLKRSINDGRLVNRAFVSHDGIRATSFHNNNHIYWQFQPIWANTGNTPTLNLRIQVNYEVRTSKLPENFDFPDNITTNPFFVIAPKGYITGQAMPIDAQLLAAAQRGEQHIYFWGWAEYNDVFSSKRRTTRFCVEITEITNDPQSHFCPNSNPVRFTFSNHPTNNFYTEIG